jgi:Uma2 family endonuclease
MSTHAKHLLTPEEYLEIERKAEFKSEYYQGEMFAMAGAGWEHNMITADVIFALWPQVRSHQCSICPGDIRIRINATGLYTYADVVVVCGKPQFADNHRDTVLNRTLIVEVLSRSSEAYDRGRKFDRYRSVESLAGYLMIASDRIHADLFTKQPGGDWLLTAADRPEDTLHIESVGCRLKLSDAYLQSGLLAPPPTAG